MTYGRPRYLGDLGLLILHDTYRETPQCGLDELDKQSRRAYDSIVDATFDREYDPCVWCLSGTVGGEATPLH